MDPHPVTAESIAAAKQAQQRERQAVTEATGLVFTDDGRITKTGQDVLIARSAPDSTAN